MTMFTQSPDVFGENQDKRPTALFEREIRPVLEEVRGSLAAVVEHVRPAARRIVDLQRVLGIAHNLSWTVFTMARASDVLTLPSLMPGERALAKFLEQAQDRGVPAAVITRAQEALKGFEHAVEVHAGSRDMFEAMVAALTPEVTDPDGDIDLKNKRAAFRANAMLYGRQTRQIVKVAIAHPSQATGQVDTILLTGTVGLQHTRSRKSWHFSDSWQATGSQAGSNSCSFEPLAPNDDPVTPPDLLKEFCSTPIPFLQRRESEPDKSCYECVWLRLGATGAVTLYSGMIERGGSSIPSNPNEEFGLYYSTNTPVELYVCDVLMHESLWDERAPAVEVLAPRVGQPVSDLLPLREKALYLGRGVEAARSPELQRHTDLLNFACDQVGWSPKEFRVFRCRVEYPLLYAKICVVFRR